MLGWLAAVLDAVGGALVLDPGTLAQAGDPGFTPVALGVALLAGVSTMLGHSVILFVNGLGGWRFLVALVATAVWTVVLLAVQGAVAGGLGFLLLDADPVRGAAVETVLLSSAPLCFGFLILIPYSGPAIGRVLEVWSFFVLVAGLDVVFDVSVWGALALAGAGWLGRQGVARLVAGPLAPVAARLWRLVAGRPALITPHDVLAGHPFVDVVARDP